MKRIRFHLPELHGLNMDMVIYSKIKEWLKPLRKSERIFLRLFFQVLLLLKNLSKLIISASFREQFISKIRYKKHFHQISHYTEKDRYPDLFEICSEYFREKKSVNVLSFGCSTGEEVFSLDEYLPNSTIIGTDISKWCIKECRYKDINKRFIFMHSGSEQFKKLSNMDAIFCLAVFQHPNNRDEFVDITTKYLFSKFEQQIIILDEKLKTGGLLFIDNCDFNFLETSIASKYFPLNVINNKLLRDRPLFNKSNQKIGNNTENFRVFLKSKS